MPELHDAQIRSALISERIQQRTDIALRELISKYKNELSFCPLDEFMISEQAWRYIETSGLDPKLVFAHPELLRAFPQVSQYYRGIALLPQKRVSDIAVSVTSWESGARKTPIGEPQSQKVARLYNAVISSIIEGATHWTLENGYRNIIATMGIGLDGTFRDIIGQDAEELIKTRIVNWLESQELIVNRSTDSTEFTLPRGYSMRYGSEPDILFRRSETGIERTVATIELREVRIPPERSKDLGPCRRALKRHLPTA